ncbi:glycosyltransferase family 4 protein [Algoriphagus sp. A40]|uniref:glycosyltransferase family 4 protein n=1 Tax=Algoriphagus sp. A40 TaxID=1945863 RepID=UPI000984C51F|nr:glycosyltransferase family 4 protein [Algoriphagus sp. A40]OOG74593.1 hypothetical protein B0E43_11370 [Algoriphagus sp. A40]
MNADTQNFPRIAQLIDTLDTGGAERMAVNLANEFSERSIPNVLLVSRHLGGLSTHIQVPHLVKLLNKNSTFDIQAFKRLLQNLDDFGAQILHAHGTSVYWGVAVKWFRPSIRLIWHDHLGISKEVIANNPRREISFLSRWIDRVITADESTRDYWLEKGFWKSGKVIYLPNFPKLISWPKKANKKFVFLHLANFRSEKGHFYLIKAVKTLTEKFRDFEVRMVGKAVDPLWKVEVINKVNQEGLGPWISVEMESDDVSKLMSEVDAGLVVSDREGLPVALLEYGLAGLPVISSDVGQCKEVLSPGNFGLIFPSGDSQALAEAMGKMLDNPAEFNYLGQIYQKHILDNYSGGKFLFLYMDLIFGLISNQPTHD